MSLRFVKMHGAANDFVVVDHRRPSWPGPVDAWVRRICDRRRGVGADGVLLLEADPVLDFAMRYHNADGGRAEFCGNGARCLARFALDRGLGRDGEVRFRTDAGPKSARRAPGGGIELSFGTVDRGAALALEACGRRFDGLLLRPGVPHFVVEVAGALAAAPLAEWGPALRAHPGLGTGGANVDLVQRLPEGGVGMRTWERGVEGETLACGSGAIASALWAATAGATSPVRVRTAGGDDLWVAFRVSGEGWEADLTGPAEVAFEGEWSGHVPAGAGVD